MTVNAKGEPDTLPAGAVLSPVGGMALALVPTMMLAAVLWHPVWDVDIFWQLKLGEMISAQHQLVLQEPFAKTHLGEPIPAFAWLAQLIMAQVRSMLGWDGLRLLNAWAWLGGFWLAARVAIQRGATPSMAAVVLPWALIIAMPSASVRPQSFALLCFGLMLFLQQWQGPAWRRIVLIAAVLLFWQNAHPSAAVAVAWLGTQAGWRCLMFLLGRCGSVPWEQLILSLLAGAVLFATPDGASLFPVAADNAAISRAIGISEWLPLWEQEDAMIAATLVPAAAVTGWLLWRRRALVDAMLVIPWLVLLVLSVLATRFTLFWAIALVPVLAPLLPRITAPVIPRWLPGLMLVVASPILIGIWPTRFDEKIPVAQLTRLSATGLKGTIYAHFPWGGPAIDLGYPNWRVAFDGRYYRYTKQEWQHYYGQAEGKYGLAEVSRLYHPVAYVLDPKWNRRLIAELRNDRQHWRVLSEDQIAVVFVPVGTGAAPRQVG